MTIRLPFAVIPHSLGTIATGNAITARPASHLGEFKHIGMVWRSNGNANLWVRGDFGAAKDIDFVSLIAATAIAPTTIRIRLGDSQAEVDGTADYDSGALAMISPAITRADGLYHSHLELPSLQTKRWWRIDIGGHSGDFEASALVMGKRVTPSTFYNPGYEFGIDDLGDIDIGRFGVAEETPGIIMRTLSMRFGWLDEADQHDRFGPLDEALGKRGVALWCFDPEPTTHRQRKTFFGWINDSPVATGGQIFGRYEKDYKIRSMI